MSILKRDYPAAYRSVQVDAFTQSESTKTAAVAAITRQAIKATNSLAKTKTQDQQTTTEIRNIEIQLKLGKPGYLKKMLDLDAQQ